MSEIQVIPDHDIISPNDAAAPNASNIKRIIADAIRRVSSKEVYVEAMGGKKMPFREYLGIMLWDIITTGEFRFADGRLLRLEEFSDWLTTVKFVSSHLDGTNTGDFQPGQINMFKVYMNINADDV